MTDKTVAVPVELAAWEVRVICVAVKDWDDAHRVEMQRGNQTFRVGPDYWDTKEEADAYAEQLRIALAAAPTPPAEHIQPAMVLEHEGRSFTVSGWIGPHAVELLVKEPTP